MLNVNDTTQQTKDDQKFVSIIIPTFNESTNIKDLLNQIQAHIPAETNVEIIIVDDNSPDGTGHIVEKYIDEKMYHSNNDIKTGSQSINNLNKNISIKVIHREEKAGLIAALVNGIGLSRGQNVLIMDADFSHPPEVVNRMIRELKKQPNCIIIGSRYVKGGAINGMPFKRFLLSVGANFIARHGLSLKNVYDPMSGFFAFPKHALEDVEFNTNGFKILLEILIKKKSDVCVKEIPYTFKDRKYGQSKLDLPTIFDYLRAVWKLYRYGRKSKKQDTQSEKRRSVRFISKAARFYTVGASGFFLNYILSVLLSNGVIGNLGYLQATAIGIAVSVTTNFLLNKFWTFEDKNIEATRFLKQYGMFVGCSSLGILIQFLSIYLLSESGMSYDISLLLGVSIASVSNFLFNKKLTFKEKIWD
ncbi:MAG TPA: glycosyltransferase family 2 protein [Candidatus Nitrosocosmicus sp.]|nr:glycosyltransferase family 2 protein [Candidatus Nitrosocosmicus sp.]